VKPLMAIGAILAALGFLGLLARSGIVYTSRDKVPHDARLHITVKQEKVLSIPPLVAGATLAAGVILMIVAARK
jgi:hypothetical protein